MDPIQSSLYQKHFPKESKIIPFSELKNFIAALLVNTHPSIGVVRPFLPNVVEIGGYHIRNPEPLPEVIFNLVHGF